MIRELLNRLGLTPEPARVDDTLDRFMQGASIPRLSSGSADIIARQREIEGQLRAVIGSQDEYIRTLEQEISQLQAERGKRG